MPKATVAVVDYGAGNIRSVSGALEALGFESRVTGDPSAVAESEVLILPGVGSFRYAMNNLVRSGLGLAIKNAVASGTRILGICLGMQLLGEWSEEDGGCEGLGLAPGLCRRFTFTGEEALRIPHMGFNSVEWSEGDPLFRDVPVAGDFYFVHSYRMDDASKFAGHTAAFTDYGGQFVSAFGVSDVVFGTQFHPELSQGNGLLLLRNFLEAAGC